MTLDISRAVGSIGYVLGTDASEDMIDKASALYVSASASPASDLSPAEFMVHDAHDTLPLSRLGSFDKVLSNAALHWMKRSPSTVARGVRDALRPGGRFAAEFGGSMNCVGIRGSLHQALRKRGVDREELDPWYFPTPKEYTELLEHEGFVVDSCDLVPRITPLGKDVGLRGWLKTFAGPFLNVLNEEEREAVVTEVEEAARPDCFDRRTGTWSVMYVRLRVLAFKTQ